MEKETQEGYPISLYIRRFDPERDEGPRLEHFLVQAKKGMTVLDALHQVKQSRDATLAFRFSCRMGVCGSCAMLINGKPGLACNTQVLDVTHSALTLAPLPNFHIIKDLVPDLAPMFGIHSLVQPYIKRSDNKEMENPSGEFYQSVTQLEEFLQFTYCIKCGSCMAACPTLATDRKYLGPMPLTQAYRYNTDSRDEGSKDRKDIVAAHHGAFNCHYAGECSHVCPKGVDPARAIQLLKKELVLDYFRLRKREQCAQVYHLPKTVERKEKILAPAHTVKK